MTRREKVLLLARAIFPDHRIVTAEDSAAAAKELGCLMPNGVRFAAFKAWFDHHISMSDEDFDDTLEHAMWDARNFFNNSRATAEFPHWSTLSYWTLEEAIALSMSKAPELVSKVTVQACARARHDHLGRQTHPASPFAMRFVQALDKATRARTFDGLPDPIRPTEFLAWAWRVGLPVAPELIRAVGAFALSNGPSDGVATATSDVGQAAVDAPAAKAQEQPTPDGPDEMCRPRPTAEIGQTTEQPQLRRERLLKWFEEEEAAAGTRGAVKRVCAREKQHRPTADPSNIAADIRKGRKEREDRRRGGALVDLLPR